MGRKRKSPGRWCWCCSRQLPNERFSGGGHARHLCRECARLPLVEREYRQAVIDIERIRWGRGRFRSRAALLERFRAHQDERVRDYVEAILARVESVPEDDFPLPDFEVDIAVHGPGPHDDDGDIPF